MPHPHNRIVVPLRGSFQNVLTSTPVFIWKFSIICQVVAYGRLKTKENFKSLASKVVAVAYERWLGTYIFEN